MSARRALVAIVALGAVGVAVTGCGGDPAPAPVTATTPPAETWVLVSGRDDHGMVALGRVPAYDGPDGEQVVTRIPDGTFARVTEIDGQWLRVEPVQGEPGWVNDFYLRGQVRLIGPPPSCAVRLGGQRREGGTLVVVRGLEGHRVEVETVTAPQTRAWVALTNLQELPPQGDRCGDIPPDDRHAH